MIIRLLSIIAATCLLACSSMDYHQHVGQQFAHLGYGKAVNSPSQQINQGHNTTANNNSVVVKPSTHSTPESQNAALTHLQKKMPVIAERLAYELGKQLATSSHIQVLYQPLIQNAQSPIEIEISQQLDQLLPYTLQAAGIYKLRKPNKAATIGRLTFSGHVKMRNQQVELSVQITSLLTHTIKANYVLIVPLG